MSWVISPRFWTFDLSAPVKHQCLHLFTALMLSWRYFGMRCVDYLFWGRKEEEVLGSFPDSLEPCCNGLIETEWDALITPVVKTEGGEDGREGRMCALISGLRWGGDTSYKYSHAGSEDSRDFTNFWNLLALSSSLSQIWTKKDTFLQPWEDIFLSSGWHRAASLQGRTPSLDPPPVGHIPRVYLVFTAGKNLKIYLTNTGIRAWKLLTSTKSPRLLKVSPV